MSHSSQALRVIAMAAALYAPHSLAQGTPPAPPAPPATTAPPTQPAMDETAMVAELKRLYAFPVLANECGYELTDAQFVRLDSAIGLAEERSGFGEEKLDDLFNGVEATLKEDLFKKGQDAACKEQEAGFMSFVTGLPD